MQFFESHRLKSRFSNEIKLKRKSTVTLLKKKEKIIKSDIYCMQEILSKKFCCNKIFVLLEFFEFSKIFSVNNLIIKAIREFNNAK